MAAPTTEAGAAVGGATGGAHTSESSETSVKHQADINADEAHTGAVHDQTRSWNANVKRTYDNSESYQMDSSARARTDWEDMRDARKRQAEDLHNLKMQAMQNAVVTADMVAKQAVRHGDLAIDRQWNVDEVAALVAKTVVFQDAIAAAVAKAAQGDKS